MAEVGERIFGGIVVVLACANRIVKMEERLLLYWEFMALCIEDRFVVDRDDSNF